MFGKRFNQALTAFETALKAGDKERLSDWVFRYFHAADFDYLNALAPEPLLVGAHEAHNNNKNAQNILHDILLGGERLRYPIIQPDQKPSTHKKDPVLTNDLHQYIASQVASWAVTSYNPEVRHFAQQLTLDLFRQWEPDWWAAEALQRFHKMSDDKIPELRNAALMMLREVQALHPGLTAEPALPTGGQQRRGTTSHLGQ